MSSAPAASGADNDAAQEQPAAANGCDAAAGVLSSPPRKPHAKRARTNIANAYESATWHELVQPYAWEQALKLLRGAFRGHGVEEAACSRAIKSPAHAVCRTAVITAGHTVTCAAVIAVMRKKTSSGWAEAIVVLYIATRQQFRLKGMGKLMVTQLSHIACSVQNNMVMYANVMKADPARTFWAHCGFADCRNAHPKCRDFQCQAELVYKNCNTDLWGRIHPAQLDVLLIQAIQRVKGRLLEAPAVASDTVFAASEATGTGCEASARPQPEEGAAPPQAVAASTAGLHALQPLASGMEGSSRRRQRPATSSSASPSADAAGAPDTGSETDGTASERQPNAVARVGLSPSKLSPQKRPRGRPPKKRAPGDPPPVKKLASGANRPISRPPGAVNGKAATTIDPPGVPRSILQLADLITVNLRGRIIREMWEPSAESMDVVCTRARSVLDALTHDAGALNVLRVLQSAMAGAPLAPQPPDRQTKEAERGRAAPGRPRAAGADPDDLDAAAAAVDWQAVALHLRALQDKFRRDLEVALAQQRQQLQAQARMLPSAPAEPAVQSSPQLLSQPHSQPHSHLLSQPQSQLQVRARSQPSHDTTGRLGVQPQLEPQPPPQARAEPPDRTLRCVQSPLRQPATAGQPDQPRPAAPHQHQLQHHAHHQRLLVAARPCGPEEHGQRDLLHDLDSSLQRHSLQHDRHGQHQQQYLPRALPAGRVRRGGTGDQGREADDTIDLTLSEMEADEAPGGEDTSCLLAEEGARVAASMMLQLRARLPAETKPKPVGRLQLPGAATGAVGQGWAGVLGQPSGDERDSPPRRAASAQPRVRPTAPLQQSWAQKLAVLQAMQARHEQQCATEAYARVSARQAAARSMVKPSYRALAAGRLQRSSVSPPALTNHISQPPHASANGLAGGSRERLGGRHSDERSPAGHAMSCHGDGGWSEDDQQGRWQAPLTARAARPFASHLHGAHVLYAPAAGQHMPMQGTRFQLPAQPGPPAQAAHVMRSDVHPRPGLPPGAYQSPDRFQRQQPAREEATRSPRDGYTQRSVAAVRYGAYPATKVARATYRGGLGGDGWMMSE